MTIKKFLKPDWRKIVLSFLLFVLLFFTLGLRARTGACVRDEEGIPRWCDSIIGFPLEFTLFSDYTPVPVIFSFLFIDIIFWCLVSYLLSCLIIWVYDKYKKKRIR